MTELYRGLLSVLNQKFNELLAELRDHVRSFKKKTTDDNNYLDVGVMGFWNFMLEIIFTLYGLTCYAVGITLTAALAIVCYPLSALVNSCALLLKNTRDPESHSTTNQQTESELTQPPVIMKKGKQNNGL